MMRSKKAMCLAAATVAAFGIAACSTEDSSSDAVSSAPSSSVQDDDAQDGDAQGVASGTSEDNQTLPPVFVDPTEVSGSTVEVPVDNVVVLSVDDVVNWSAEVSDPMVAKWTVGGTKDGATYNPGFQPIDEGVTEVLLTAPDGKEITFTLQVTAADEDH